MSNLKLEDIEAGKDFHSNLTFATPLMFPTQPVRIPAQSSTPPMTAYVESRPTTPTEMSQIEVDDEFDFSVSLALIILIIYMLLGSFIFHYTDNWGLFHSFYFVYISMSTIGFGDFVPQDPVSMIASSVYLLFGLALTTMCINVVQEKFNDTFNRAKAILEAKMGLDSNQVSEKCPSEDKERIEFQKSFEFILKDENIGQSLRERIEKKLKCQSLI